MDKNFYDFYMDNNCRIKNGYGKNAFVCTSYGRITRQLPENHGHANDDFIGTADREGGKLQISKYYLGIENETGNHVGSLIDYKGIRGKIFIWGKYDPFFGNFFYYPHQGGYFSSKNNIFFTEKEDGTYVSDIFYGL